ncbi:MAG: lipoyl-dependent peroxiredoxin [Myxococcales bacterium]|nr:lipoyl-dependent peroxiredoxin [Myxococcales bacterium]
MLGPIDGGRHGLAVELEASIPGVEREVAEKILKRTHEVCPYSNATRGNIEVIEVTLKVASEATGDQRVTE